MKIKVLVTALVLATSSVAMAAPSNGFGFKPEIRDHRQPRFDRWSLLATGSLVRGRETVRVHSGDKLDKLKIELQVGARASMYVDKLVLTYGNGRTQTIEVNKALSARDASVIVDINGNGRARKLTSITVIGRGSSMGFRPGASFKLLGL